MIEDSIREHAVSVSALKSLIGKRFHLTVNHKSKDNYVVLTVLDDSTEKEVDYQDSISEASVQFDCYSKTPANAKAIAKQIRLAFNSRSFTTIEIKVQTAKEQRRAPDFNTDSKLYRESLDYIFYYHHPLNNEV